MELGRAIPSIFEARWADVEATLVAQPARRDRLGAFAVLLAMVGVVALQIFVPDTAVPVILALIPLVPILLAQLGYENQATGILTKILDRIK
jgi:hypothetical protein